MNDYKASKLLSTFIHGLESGSHYGNFHSEGTAE